MEKQSRSHQGQGTVAELSKALADGSVLPQHAAPADTQV